MKTAREFRIAAATAVELDNYDDAAHYLQRAVNIYPTDPHIHRMLEHLKDYQSIARAKKRRALKRDEDD